MASFTDRLGTIWQVSPTVGHLAPLKALYALDLGTATQLQGNLSKLFEEMPAQDIVGALWIICEDQAQKAGLTPDDWAHRFDGDTIEAATVALGEAVIGFFPRQKIAQAMKSNLRTALEKMDTETVTRIERLTSNDTAGNLPESSGSIPGP